MKICRSLPHLRPPPSPLRPLSRRSQPTPPVGPDFSKIEVKTFDLGKDTYMLEGAGGNVTVAIGKDAIIMVDGQFAPMHDKLKAAIEAKSKLPIKYLVNTHYHGDHTGGNEGFTKDRRHGRGASVRRKDPRRRLHQWSHRREDAAASGRGAAETHLQRREHGAACEGPRTRSCAIRSPRIPAATLTCSSATPMCSSTGDTVTIGPLSEYRFRQWRQHQGHDQGVGRVSAR